MHQARTCSFHSFFKPGEEFSDSVTDGDEAVRNFIGFLLEFRKVRGSSNRDPSWP